MSFTEPLEITMKRQELHAQRIKESKDLALNYSKEIVDLFKEYETQKSRQKDYKDAIETYKKLLSEIDQLKQTKEEIMKAKSQNEITKEQEKISYENYIKKVEENKRKFDKFMKEKGKEAFDYLRKMKETKAQLDEAIHKYEQKKKTKNDFNDRAKILIENYKEKERKKIEYEKECLNEKINNENSLNILYKTIAPFHNNGNKIDYSTTCFHNIVVFKHDDINKYMNAYDRAEEEHEKMEERKKSKEKQLENFNNNMQKNFDEILRQNKAKDNLARLNEELEKIAKAKKKNNLNKVNLNSNLNNANALDKKSENIMNKLLEKQQNSRTKLLTGNNDPKLNDKISQANDESMREFYRDEEEEKENEKYHNKAMEEHNEEIENQNKNKQYFYEEPIARENFHPIKEKIRSVNPIDIESYQKAVYEDNWKLKHTESPYPKVNFERLRLNKALYPNRANNTSVMLLGNDSNIENSTFSVFDALGNSTTLLDNKNSSMAKNNKNVKDFLGKLNSSGASNSSAAGKKKFAPKKTVKFERLLNDNMFNDSSVKGKIDIKNEIIQEIDDVGDMDSFGFKDEKINKKSFEDNADSPIEFKPDSNKWKVPKDELIERKKKMLQDKSSINKK